MINNLNQINCHIFYTQPFPLYCSFNLHPIQDPNSTPCRPNCSSSTSLDHARLHALPLLLPRPQSALFNPTSEDVLKLGTSQGEIWNHSDYNPPFPFFVLHFRTKKKLPFRFITNGNNPSFETQVFQTGFIALCLQLKYYYIFAPNCTVENSKSGAARSAPK